MSDHHWVIMPIEVQRRELDAKLVVAALAAARGYKVLIGQDRVIRRLARFLPKGILFDKSIGGKGDQKVYRYNRLGYKIAAMDEEGTGFLVAPEMFMDARMADDTLALTTRWFCISEEVRNLCIEKYPQHEDKFITTGLGRTDTWREPLVGMYKEEVEQIRQRHGRFLLFNSNFGIPNHARGKKFVSRQIKKVESMYDAGKAEYDRLLKENTANLQAYIDVLPQILKWLPEHKIVVRPHPAENIEFWEEKFKHEPRIHVELGGVVTPWIIAAEFMFHHGCTTGVEAEIIGCPQVNYAPIPDMYHDTDMAKTFSQFVHSPDELKNSIVEAVINGNHKPMSLEGKSRYFASLEGKLVCEKIVDEFDRISFSSKPFPDWIRLLQYSPRHLVSRYKDISRGAKAYTAQKFHGVSHSELTTKLNFCHDVLDDCKPMQVREVFENLFEIKASGSA